MSELVPYEQHLPAGTETPSFTRLAARLAVLAMAALRLKEGLWLLKVRMERDAARHDRIAELCVQAEVDPAEVALIGEAAFALRACAQSAVELAGAADGVEADARGFRAAHQTEYRAQKEAHDRMKHRQARPGFYRRS